MCSADAESCGTSAFCRGMEWQLGRYLLIIRLSGHS